MSNELEKIALSQRASLIPLNTYNSSDDSQEYGATHTRALSDTVTPVAGKGTGVFLDTYNGGGDYDINGNPAIVGSGRIQNIVLNQYDALNGYKTPDMSGNIGQVVI